MWTTKDQSSNSIADEIISIERKIAERLRELDELRASRERLVRKRGDMLDALREKHIARRGYATF